MHALLNIINRLWNVIDVFHQHAHNPVLVHQLCVPAENVFESNILSLGIFLYFYETPEIRVIDVEVIEMNFAVQDVLQVFGTVLNLVVSIARVEGEFYGIFYL